MNKLAHTDKAKEALLNEDISSLKEEDAELLISRFWKKLLFKQCQLHPLTMAWLHHSARQLTVLKYLQENDQNDIQILVAAISPDCPFSQLFNEASGNRIKGLIKEMIAQETRLLKKFTSLQESGSFDHPEGRLMDKNVLPIIFSFFNNRPLPSGNNPLPEFTSMLQMKGQYQS